MTFTAIINIPGYLPMDDEPPVFDTVVEAWQYLADERRDGEDSAEDWGPDNGLSYSDTVFLLQQGSEPGVIYGPTPGYEGTHDLGLAYSVQEVES